MSNDFTTSYQTGWGKPVRFNSNPTIIASAVIRAMVTLVLLAGLSAVAQASIGITFSSTDATCTPANGQDGALTANPTGGTAPYTYLWDQFTGSATTQSISSMYAGDYSVTVTDALGATAAATGTIVPSSPTNTGTVILPAHCGDTLVLMNDYIYCGGVAGATRYQYQFLDSSNGDLIYDFSPSGTPMSTAFAPSVNLSLSYATTYLVRVRVKIAGCWGGFGAACPVTTPINIPPTQVRTADCGKLLTNANDYFYIDAVSGADRYQFEISDGAGFFEEPFSLASNPTATNFALVFAASDVHCGTTYGVRVRAKVDGIWGPYGASCNISTSTYDNLLSDLAVSGNSSTGEYCNAGNATASVTASGSNVPLAYNWPAGAAGQTTASVTALAAGTYTVTVLDTSNCAVSSTIVVANNGTPTVSVTSTVESCSPGTDGTVTATISGGSAPFTYAWNGAAAGQTSQTATGLLAGSYTPTVTDAFGCSASSSVSLVKATVPVVSLQSTSDLSCYQSADGSIDLSLSGGTAPFTYSWNDGGATLDRTGLDAGVYRVTVTDTYGCTATLPGDVSGSVSYWTAEQTAVDLIAGNDGTLQGAATYDTGDCNDAFSLDGVSDHVSVPDDASLDVGTSFTYMAWFNTADVAQEDPNTGDIKQCILQFGDTDADGQSNMIGLFDEVLYFGAREDASTFTEIEGGETIEDDTWYHIALTYDGTTAILYLNGEEEDQVDCTMDISGSSALRMGMFKDPDTGDEDFWFYGMLDELRVFSRDLSDTEINAIIDGGCDATGSVVLTEPAELVISASETTIPCVSNTNGELTSSVAGGTTPYTYLWSTGATGANLTGVANGTYTLTVTGSDGCFEITSQTVANAASPPALSPTSTLESCSPGSDGTATAGFTGGTSPFSFAWNGAAAGQTTQTATGLIAGSYTPTVTDANGCASSSSISVTKATIPAISIASSTDLSCYQSADGAIDLSVAGGTAPFTYSWNDGGSTLDRTGLDAGNYLITVSDGLGCTATLPGDVSGSVSYWTAEQNANDQIASNHGTLQGATTYDTGDCNDAFSLDGVSDHVSVADDASLDVGTSFTYMAWFNTADVAQEDPNTGDIKQCILQFGDTDADGQSNMIGLFDEVLYFGAREDASTFTEIEGGETIEDDTWYHIALTYDGTTAILYLNGEEEDQVDCTMDISGSSAMRMGMFKDPDTGDEDFWFYGMLDELRVFNRDLSDTEINAVIDGGCDATGSVVLTEPAELVVSASETTIPCVSNTNGELTSSVSGGTTPYTYLWSTGATGANLTGVANGTYTLTVTGSDGCFETTSQTVANAASAPALSPTSTLESCSPGSDGTATAGFTGGTSPFTYAWNGAAAGQTTQTATGLIAGSYTPTVTDANGCASSSSISVTKATIPSISIASSTDLSCYQSADGAIDLSVSGGTSPFTYSWNDGGSTLDRTGLDAGNYLITVSDGLGCTATLPGDVSGSVSYWTAEQNANDQIASNHGTLQGATTYDPGDCNDAFSLDGVSDHVSVADDASLDVGTSFTYMAWFNTADVAQEDPNTGDIKQCILQFGDTDADGQSNMIGLFDEVLYFGAREDASTFTEIEGGETIEDDTWYHIALTYDGTTAILYLNGEEEDQVDCTMDISGSSAMRMGMFKDPDTGDEDFWFYGMLDELRVFNRDLSDTEINAVIDGGCDATGSVVLTEPAELVVSASETTIPCVSNTNGELTSSVSGGTTPYTYLWSTGATSANLTGVANGTYTLTVTGSDGCFETTSQTVANAASAPALSPTSTLESCSPGSDGTATAGFTGGTSPFTFAWNGAAAGQTTQTATGLIAGSYTPTVTDANGCASSSSISVTKATIPSISIASSTDLSCYQSADGAIDLSVAGGTAPFTYSWNDGGSTLDRTGLDAGNYLITVSDGLGCTATLPGDVSGSISYWTAEQNANDQIASNDGTLQGATTYDTGDCNDAFSLDGVSDHVSVADDASLDVGTSFTYMAWFNTADVAQEDPNTGDIKQCILQFGDTDADGQSNMIGLFDEVLYFGAREDASTFTEIEGGETIEDDTWYHIALTYDGTTAILYLNGEEEDQVDCTMDISGSSALRMGMFKDPDTGDEDFWFYGLLDELRVFNRDLSDTEINAVIDGGCDATGSVVLTEPAELVVSASETTIPCVSSSNGELTSSVSGGATPYTYLWSTGGTGASISGLTAGTYTVTVTDAASCAQSASESVSIAGTGPIVNMSSSSESCSPGSDGSATATASAGATPYTYAWSGAAAGQTALQATGLAAGSYTTTVTDANGCAVTGNAVVLGAPVGTATATGTDVSCPGAADGTIDITMAGGSAPFTYTWSDASNDEDRTGIAGASYQVTVIDAQGCEANLAAPIVVAEAPAHNLVITETTPACSGFLGGVLETTMSGGTSPYTYLWITGSTGTSLSGITMGNYALTVTDAAGCTETGIEPIANAFPLPAISMSSLPESCLPGGDGSVTASVTGGKGALTYGWSGAAAPQTTSTVTGLSVGTYTVTVQDEDACAANASIGLAAATAPTLTINAQDVTCNGDADGSISITKSGGALPFTYTWSDGPATEDRASLPPGNYSMTVVDGNGCDASTGTIAIAEPSVLGGAMVNNTIACTGNNTGELQYNPTGGVTPHAYLWSTGGTGANISSLANATYTVTVTDDNGCTIAGTGTVSTVGVSPTATVSTTVESCVPAGDGTATAVPAGGTAPYTYTWSTGGSLATIATLATATYTVTVADAIGCTGTATGAVGTAGNPTIALDGIIDAACNSNIDGTISISASGGVTPYSYAWNDGPTVEDRTGGASVAAGIYAVTLTDANGCTDDLSGLTVSEPAVLTGTVTNNTVACSGANTGTLQISPAGGTAPYTYVWSTGGTSNSVSGLANGTYTVTVTDNNGCVITDDETISGSGAGLAVTVSTTLVSCNPGGDGTATAGLSGGTAPFTYLWSTGGSTATISALSAGTYTTTVTDAIGCTGTNSGVVAGAGAPTLALDGSTDITCNAAADGTIDVSISSGTAPFTYTWSDGDSNQDRTGLAAGVYGLTVTDQNGCVDILGSTVTMTDPAALTASVTDNSTACSGNNNGQLSSTASGGTGTLTYAWSSGGSTSSLSGIGNGTYTLSVTDASNCVITETTTITILGENPVVTVDTTGVTCGFDNGTARANVAGGNSPFTYAWDAGTGSQTSDIATGLPTGTYTVTVTGADGCVDSDFGIIGVAPPAIPLTFTSTLESCAPGNDASATVTAQAGSPPFTYLWEPDAASQTTQTATGLNYGFYDVTVTDAGGCSATDRTLVFQEGASVPTTMLTANSCGSTLKTLQEYVYVNRVNGATRYQIEVTDDDGNYDLIIGSATNTAARFFSLGVLDFIDFGQTYHIRARCRVNNCWGAFGPTCDVFTPADAPTTKLRAQYCNTTLSALNQYVYIDYVVGAQRYQFEVSEGGSVIEERFSNSSTPTATYFSLFFVDRVEYGKTYTIRARAKVGNVWYDYGLPCTLTTPAPPVPSVQGEYCGTTLANFNDYFHINAVAGAQRYQYEYDDGAGNILTSFSYSATPKATWMTFLFANGAKVNTTYSIRVRAKVGGAWGDYGPSCDITTPATMSKAEELMLNGGFMAEVERNVLLFPNPNNGRFTVQSYDVDEKCTLSVLDLTGRVMWQRTHLGGLDAGAEIGLEELPAGMYLLRVVDDRGQVIKRVIVE